MTCGGLNIHRLIINDKITKNILAYSAMDNCIYPYFSCSSNYIYAEPKHN